jgi:hypothetical protein
MHGDEVNVEELPIETLQSAIKDLRWYFLPG